ncbi:uncharacterized protein PODANS_1_18730 [Podospora anserina S mat+]|uniref:Podospora anserina S mat+ genomic DNA chromosome 1, supercontig 4 n=1 Tax=Podospora anserina (strain S / ATCC MYA-4624 / DSM 980 / FGSC 10383) TaxID=515849 RepID=B2AUD1_PODAN|nr:uncharacterized protein PODANS_1_18730 [Podospora anserina S mat+]CAP68004.1 unnamed protein product [Podospora anserina S mat+]
MSDQVLLPQVAYRPPSPQGRRRPARTLNPIMEEPEHSRDSFASRRRRNGPSVEKIEQWLSPMSDHFPTPRGMHFLAAPILPATPSVLSQATNESEPELDNDDVSSEASSSNPSFQWNHNSNNRESIMTDVTEFDDLYDVSDDEIRRKQRLQANGIGRQRSSTRSSRSSRNLKRSSRASLEFRRSLTPLVIPEEAQQAAKKVLSPIPPTPPSAVAMSPAIMSLMELRQTQDTPRVSAPPSLDGSINSEEMAAMSAPPTPVVGSEYGADEEWSGVRLQPGALETLQALAGDESAFAEQPTQVIEVPQEMAQTRRQPPRIMTNLNRAPSAARLSLADLSKLEIPSPGGFFSELSSASRQTWHAEKNTEETDEGQPPTSTTAENFYKIPWSRDRVPPPPPRPLHLDNLPSAIIERVVEFPETQGQEDLPTAIRIEPTPVPLTAIRIPPTPRQSEATASETAVGEPSSPIVVTEIIAELDRDYVAKQEENVVSHAGRTQMWLMAQRAYLQGVAGFSDEVEEQESEASEHESEAEDKVEEPKVEATEEVPLKKSKSVRFSALPLDNFPQPPKKLPPKLLRQESAYYRAFTDFTVRSCHTDAFVHRQPRFEALQAQRISLRDAHRNQLLGKYQLSVVPQCTCPLGTSPLPSSSTAAGLFLLPSASASLVSPPLPLAQAAMASPVTGLESLISAARAPATGPGMLPSSSTNCKIYTVTTKAIRQLSNSNIRGPPNHRQVAVERLTKLPFADNQFDLISARELHAVLKMAGENGVDEWDACLAECMRVLKPGGYIEFNLLDADIINAGELGNAKAVEFGFALQTLGYDARPTKNFISRLDKAGFEDVRRAWVAMPVGPKKLPKPVVSVGRDEAGGEEREVLRMEAVVSGSSDNIAAVTGLVAGWSWEKWLLRAEMERAAGELRLADTVTPGKAMKEAGKMIADVSAVVEEGRAKGSLFRCLKGYARKPVPKPKVEFADELNELDRSGSIRICLDTESLY